MKPLHILVVIMTMSAAPALALEPCGDLVVDAARVLDDEPALERAAAALERATGATVRVRISQDYAPKANLDDYVRAVRTDICPSWSNPSGTTETKTLIIWVATEVEDIGFYYGSGWNARLRPNEDAVFDSMIQPLLDLDNRDYDKALLSGLERLDSILRAGPATPRASDPVPPKPAPVVIPATPREPVDMKPFLMVVAGAVIALILFFSVRTGLRHRATARREEDERQTARLAAEATFNEVGEVSLEAGNAVVRAEKAIAAAEAMSSPELIAMWREKLRDLKDLVEGLRRQYNAPTDPSKQTDLPQKAYDDANTAYMELLPKYRSARDDLTQLAKDVEKIPDLAAAMPTALEDLQRDVVAAVGTLIANFGRDGFVTTGPDTIFRTGEAAVGEMRTAMAARDWGRASTLLAMAREKFDAARAAAESLPRRRDKVTERLTALRENLGSYAEAKAEAEVAMQAMVEKFTQDCYSLVADNVTKAADLHGELKGELPALEKLVASQDWDAVEARLEQVEDDVADIVDLYTAVGERQKRLVEMVPDADAELAEATRSIKAAEDYLAEQPKYDTSENRSVVAKLKSDLGQVPEQKKGKLLPVVERLRRATAVDDAADAFLAQIEARVADDIERANRADRLLKDIGTRIAEYDRYAVLHRGDIPVSAIDVLKDAEDGYRRLKRTDDVEEMLTEGATLGQLLDAFHTTAKRSVSEAEDARRRAREAARRAADAARRREEDDDNSYGSRGLGLSIGSSRPSRSSYSSPSGLGGGSRSFGISSGSGGGSRSFASSGGSRSFGGR
jgi:uncharacterized membrane protein YgcG